MDKFRKIMLKEKLQSIIFIVLAAVFSGILIYSLYFWAANDHMTLMQYMKKFWYVMSSGIVLRFYVMFEKRIWKK